MAAFYLILLALPAILCQQHPQVAFTMTRGKKEGTYINFNIVATNVNAELSQEVGAFRCTHGGLYYFTFSALPPRSSSLKVSLRKNRIPITTLFGSEGTHSTVTGSMTLWLVNNDIVYPFVEDGEIYESTAKTRALTSFSGFRIGGPVRKPDPVGGSLYRGGDEIESNLAEPDPSDHIDILFNSDNRDTNETTTIEPPL